MSGFQSLFHTLAATRGLGACLAITHTRWKKTVTLNSFSLANQVNVFIPCVCYWCLSAAVTVAPAYYLVVPPTCTSPSHPHIFLFPPMSPLPGSSCSLERGVYSSHHDEKWMERLAALCHRMRVVFCIPTRQGLVVVTDQMAAASDHFNYAAYRYPKLQEALGSFS